METVEDGGKMNIKDRIKEFRRVRSSELRPNPKNWRTHPESQKNALKGILAEVGIVDALLARELEDGTLQLIDGHLRAETLHDDDVPVLILDVNEEEADKILATFDPLAAMAEANETLLEELLSKVETESEALAKMLDELAQDAGISLTEDEVPEEIEVSPSEELLRKWKCELGQVWDLKGKEHVHELHIGDATTLQIPKVDGICTDPPYDLSPEIIVAAFNNYSDKAIVVGSGSMCVEICKQWEYRLDFTWRHRQPRSFPTPHQPVLYHHWIVVMAKDSSVKTGWTRPNPGWGSVIECEREFEDSEMGHGKSAELVIRMLEGFPTWKTVGDPFVGSGTTFVACEHLGKKCVGSELQPMHAAVTLERCERSGIVPQLRVS